MDLVNMLHICYALAEWKMQFTFGGLYKLKWHIFNTEWQLRLHE